MRVRTETRFPAGTWFLCALSGVLVGAGIFLAGLAWFYMTTFVVIPHFAAEAYTLDQTPYAARYGALGDSFGDVLISLVTQPLAVLRIALEPLRVDYLLGLLIPTAGLALLTPGYCWSARRFCWLICSAPSHCNTRASHIIRQPWRRLL